MSQTEQDAELVIKKVQELLEHFDSVRIFVTRHEGHSESTWAFTKGGGNFYAQLGQINEWSLKQDHNILKDEDETI